MNSLHDITVAFSGRNVSKFTVASIKTFLLIYPELKDNIVYFDDDSTVECLNDIYSTGVRVVLRDECNFESEYISNLNLQILEYPHESLFRVHFMLDKIQRNCRTKYLFISDNDVIYIKRGFLESYINNSLSGYLLTSANCNYMDDKEKSNDIVEHLSKYKEEFSFYTANFITTGNKILSNRIWFYHTFICMDDIKSLGLDVITPEDKRHIEFMAGEMFDTGLYSLNLIINRGIKYFFVDHIELQKYCFHLFSINVANNEKWEKLKIADKLFAISNLSDACVNTLHFSGLSEEDLIQSILNYS